MAAAPILSWEGLGLTQGSGWLFQDLDIHIAPRDRLALIGRNGAGKSTLLKLIAGTVEGDRGKRSVQPGTRVVVLEQEPDVAAHPTLLDYCLSGKDAPPRHEVEAIASQLGIDLSRGSQGASGGERRRAAICRALASEPDLLLLDEPTNHLDLSAIDWLESWLMRYTGAFVVISHDRTFLTRLTRATLWLDRGSLRRREVGFGGYEAWEEEVYANESRAAEKLDAKLKIEEHWKERGVTARRKRNMGRLEKLYEMRAQRASMIGPQGIAKMALASDDSKTKSVIVAEHISKSYGDRPIIRDFSLRIQRRDRIGLVGGNGAGKTTLLKMLTGELAPDTGEVKLAQTLTSVIIDQQRSLLHPDKRVRDIVAEGGDWVDVRGERKHVHGYLKDFLFNPGLVDARVGTLSGGERSRLLLAREFARPSNLLVLDEPTNDLDLETLDLLQEVIADYDGTVLIVSHDRDFLDRTVTITLGLDGSGRVDVVAGGYADWQRQRQARATSNAPKPKPADKADAPAPVMPARKAKLSYKDQRDYDLLPARIEALDAEIAKLEEALHDADLYTKNPQRFAALTAALDKARADKDASEERWLELAEMVEG
ncbi:ATP-binding cassette domain-containing protein [Novosphingobium sp. FSY-8]|uniref:ATP-binding cassette domain-containing protein n=1 Tax=Novosphingobium ovatum TaxID=1908523 RepID=A0ABW9XHL9_9SPHN|nr:ATP-binding cassette domain-containing protein [Novosphingobium ovatum]NBC38054.1 ATP-binding cassette domain-containing protein [Novosphingobium ovatum]